MSRTGTMEPRLLLLLLLLLPAPLTAHTLAAESLQQIPHSSNAANETQLILPESQISLNAEDRQALASYSQLEKLDLTGGRVTRITRRYFAVVSKVQALSLSRNNISSLDAESFSGLDNLAQLDLSHNLLTSIDMRLFTQLRKIEVLNLQGNPWNCSCPLLDVSEETNNKSAGFKLDSAPGHTCASLDSQTVLDFLSVTDECNRTATPGTTPGRAETTTAAVSQPLSSSHATQKTAVTSQSATAKDTPPPTGGGNSWKFTVCVIALAAGTFTLILCAIKGPSWYKLYHNYRHRRLSEQEEEREEWEEAEGGQGGVSTIFPDIRRQADHQLFTFDFHNGQAEGWEEGEDEEEEVGEGYFEDPYFKRAE